MDTIVRLITQVQPGHRVEIISPDLTDGANVEVLVTPIISVDDMPHHRLQDRQTIHQLIQSQPRGPRSADSWDEIETTLNRERNEWDQ